jgi:biopolymer transport protein ExbB/TolQ
MTRRDQARLARLACERKAAEVRLEMQRGLHGLNAVAGTAFFLGTLLTVRDIFSSFKGNVGEMDDYFFAIAYGLGSTLHPMAVSLVIAIPALLAADRIRLRCEDFAVEMHSAALQLENYLLLYQNDRGKPSTCSAT